MQDARHAQLNYAVVMAGRALAPTLPAIHPFAMVIVFVGDEYRRLRLDQPLLGREELVRRIRHARTEPRLFELYPLVVRVQFLAHVAAPGACNASSRRRAIL